MSPSLSFRGGLLALFFAASPAFAQTITLQHSGRLLDASDEPLSGLVSLRFSIHTSAGLDPQVPDETLWSATYDVAVLDGLYTVELGAAPGTPLPDAAVLVPGRWLEVAVADTTLRPRLRIFSVPHALVADVAEDANLFGGKPPSFYTDAANLQGVLGPSVSYEGAPIEDEQIASAARWSKKLDTVSVSAPLSGDGTTGSPLALSAASAQSDGYLSAADHAAFSAKLATVSVDESLVGDGTSLAPLQVAPSLVSRLERVAVGASLVGDGSTASPLEVAPGYAAARIATAASQCAGSGDSGRARFDPATGGLQICDGSRWVHFTNLPRSCRDVIDAGLSTGDGLYRIDPTGGDPSDSFLVWCDMTYDGGGWAVVATNAGDGDVAHLQLASREAGINQNSPTPPQLSASDGEVTGKGYIALRYWNRLAPWGELRFVVGANSLRKTGWRLIEGTWHHRWQQASCEGPDAAACWSSSYVCNFGFHDGTGVWRTTARICYGWTAGEPGNEFAKQGCPASGHWFGWFNSCSTHNVYGNNPSAGQRMPEWMDVDEATGRAFIAIR